VKVGKVEGSSKELASELACSRAGDESPDKAKQALNQSIRVAGVSKRVIITLVTLPGRA